MIDIRRRLSYITAFFAIWTLLALVLISLSLATALSGGNQPNVRLLFLIQFTRFYTWAGLSPFIYRFVRRFPVEIRPLRWRKLLVHVAALLLFCTIHQTIFALITWQLDPALHTRFASIFDYYLGNFFSGVYLGVLVYALIVFAIQAFLFYQNFRAEEEKKLRVTAQLAKAELHALKMQLQPHFLFNTLHSISSLVLEDPPKANGMIARLGDFLRLTLEHSERQTVTLKEEIEFARCYLEIEQVRFSDRLKIDFNVDPASLTAQVPHLILQPIVENAVQHAIAPHAANGFIKINAKRFGDAIRIEVADSGAGINPDDDSNDGRGVGLTNVRSRLKQLYGSHHKFELTNKSAGGLIVVLEIPFVTDTNESPLTVQ